MCPAIKPVTRFRHIRRYIVKLYLCNAQYLDVIHTNSYGDSFPVLNNHVSKNAPVW